LTHTHSRGNDHVGLVNRWRPGDSPLRGLSREIPDPPPGGIEVTSVPLAPAAHEVFSPEEMAERIEKLAALYAHVPDLGDVVCWACGRLAPRNSGWSARANGWVSRQLGYIGFPGIRELYCPECFKRWGWPDCPAEAAGWKGGAA